MSKKKITFPSLLHEHAKRFEKRIEKVTEGIYSAIGYGLSNSILIVTEEGNVIVDTTESFQVATEINKEFKKISALPTVALIYTHGHGDHVLGAEAFIEESTEIYSHVKTKDFINLQFSKIRPIIRKRVMRQYGLSVPNRKDYIPCYGVGPELNREDTNPRFVIPTQVFDNSIELNIGGLKLILDSVPGETDDHIFVWIPEKKALLCGDNYYPCFPNLYTIRGTSPRPVYKWVQSLDKMRDLGAEYLVPGHAEPVYGKERTNELLTVYRDAIQYVHDSVIRGINKDKTRAQLAEEIKLPKQLSQYKELMELYGDVSQSVLSIYDGYIGWFDGNATNLKPLPTKERAEKIIHLSGGYERILEEAKSALQRGEYQWAAEVCDMLLCVTSEPKIVLEIKSDALFELGLLSNNSNNRGYYLQQAYELKGEVKYRKNTPEELLSYNEMVSIDQFISNMTVLLDPITSQDENISVCLEITDEQVNYRINIRNSIAEIRRGIIEQPDFRIKTTARVWKQLVLNVIDPQDAVDSGGILIEGELDQLKQFLNLFKY